MASKQRNKDIGKIGESIAAEFLRNKGLVILEMNYLKSFGEIDIVARGTKGIHFVEVKTVTHETKADLEHAVTHETWRPEEMVHSHKLHQIAKAIEAWQMEHSYTGNLQIDVVAVRLVPRETYSVINYVENVIID